MAAILCIGCGAVGDSDGAALYCNSCYQKLAKRVDSITISYAVSDYLHTLDTTKPLAYYMARGLSSKISKIVSACTNEIQQG